MAAIILIAIVLSVMAAEREKRTGKRQTARIHEAADEIPLVARAAATAARRPAGGAARNLRRCSPNACSIAASASRPPSKTFSAPRLKNLADPFLLPNMAAAVERLLRAREQNEPLVIFGDYDVDGVTSTALLLEVLRAARLAGGFLSAAPDG